MDNYVIQIYVSKNHPDTPWILRFERHGEFIEERFYEVEIRTPLRTITLDRPEHFGRYALETKGIIERHPLQPRAIIQALGLPKKW